MSKLKFISILAAGLLISNLLLLVFIVSPKSEPKIGHKGPRNIIIKKLNFNESQIEKYDDFIQWHRTKIREKEQKMMELKNALYTNIVNAEGNTFKKDSIIGHIAATQKEIEGIHYQHFQDIEALCVGEQKNLFKDLTTEIASLFAPRKAKKP